MHQRDDFICNVSWGHKTYRSNANRFTGRVIMKTKIRFNLSLRLIAGLSAAFLLLLLIFASHYQFYLEQVEQHTGVLELMAATIPLLSLLLAAALSRAPGKRHVARRRSPSATQR